MSSKGMGCVRLGKLLGKAFFAFCCFFILHATKFQIQTLAAVGRDGTGRSARAAVHETETSPRVLGGRIRRGGANPRGRYPFKCKSVGGWA